MESLRAPSQSSSTTPSDGAPNHGSETVMSYGAPYFPRQTVVSNQPFAVAVTSDNIAERQKNKFDHVHQLHTASVAERKERPLHVPTIEYYLDASRLKLQHTHRPSKSRINRIPQKMSSIATSSAAKNSLSARSGTQERDHAGDDGLLHPKPRETIRSHWGSDSTIGLETASRKDGLFDALDPSQKLVLPKQHEPRSAEDLKQMRSRRKQGEGQLRTALLGIGNFATDVTRILDYTYYNLLEKMASLTSTIALFQELSESVSAICNDFERETSSLDQDIRKQMRELNSFQPQVQKIERLEERMSSGKSKAEALGKKLEAIRDEIDRWEKREAEWQTRVARRLRIFWAVVTASLLIFLIVFISQHHFTSNAPGLHGSLPVAATDHCSADPSPGQLGNERPITKLDKPDREEISPEDQLGSVSHASCQTASVADIPSFDDLGAITERTGLDPLKRLDEL